MPATAAALATYLGHWPACRLSLQTMLLIHSSRPRCSCRGEGLVITTFHSGKACYSLQQPRAERSSRAYQHCLGHCTLRCQRACVTASVTGCPNQVRHLKCPRGHHREILAENLSKECITAHSPRQTCSGSQCAIFTTRYLHKRDGHGESGCRLWLAPHAQTTQSAFKISKWRSVSEVPMRHTPWIQP